jgi:hypothetical protein
MMLDPMDEMFCFLILKIDNIGLVLASIIIIIIDAI